MAHQPVKLFISYSHKDERFREHLEEHLHALKRRGLIEDWHDRRIAPDTGEDSEYPSGVPSKSWSSYAGESITSSITTAPSLEDWYAGEGSGTYLVASKALAQYSDYELTHSLLHENKANNCAVGPYVDLDRSGYSGKIQTWYDCGGREATSFSVAAAPEGRECVVALAARINSEADREAIQHVVDTFDVDCENIANANVVDRGLAEVARLSAVG